MNWELLNWQRLLDWPGPDTATVIWLGQVFLVVLATVSINFILMRVLDIVAHFTGKTENLWDDAVVDALRVPLRLLLWIVGLSLAAELLYSVSEAAIFEYVEEIRRIAFIAIVAMFLLRLAHHMEHNLASPELMDEPLDKTTAQAIGKLLRVSVIITAALIALQTLGYSISGVLAFGGIGGIAVAFAAKDLLANFFGGMMIYLDKPFKVGEWIQSPDRTIQGTVEHIGWRLTRIRTFELRPIYVPNATFTTIVLENPSRMLNRRIYETVGLRYEDWQKMPAITEGVRAMLEAHPDVDSDNNTIMVNLTTYGSSRVEFFIYAFTKTTQWAEFNNVKQDVMMKVMEIVHEHEAQFALPARTLHVAGAGPYPGGYPPFATEQNATQAAEETSHADRG